MSEAVKPNFFLDVDDSCLMFQQKYIVEIEKNKKQKTKKNKQKTNSMKILKTCDLFVDNKYLSNILMRIKLNQFFL